MIEWCLGRTAFVASLILGISSAALSQTLYFPQGDTEWETVDPTEAGWSSAGLRGALDYAQRQRSSGVVVLVGGRVLAEDYWEVLPPVDGDPGDYPNLIAGRTASGHTVEDVASLQKTVVSVLAGIARARGVLDFDATVSDYLGAGWSRADPDEEARITVRHLLSMTSGLGMQGQFELPVGEKWMYNTPIYGRLLPVLEAASGLTVHEITSQWLTARIGMSDSDWGARSWMPAGRGAASMGFRSSARDLARFGLMVLAEGMWRGEDVVGDPDYFREALVASQPYNDSYGLLWWLNGGATHNEGRNPEMQDGPLITSAPHDLVAALGGLGRKIYIVPSLRLVVTRIGDAPEAAFDNEFWRRLMIAAPD